MLEKKNYSIRADYVPNEPEEFADHQGYWNEQRVYASRFYQHAVYQYAQAVLVSRQYSSVIDVGCGPGTKLARLVANANPESSAGIDLPESIALCRKMHGEPIKWLEADFSAAGDIQLGQRYDLVICADVIEHVVDPDSLLDLMKRLVNPGGLLLISTPERSRLLGESALVPSNRYHIREWCEEEFTAYLKDMGFENTKIEYSLPVQAWPNSIFYREVIVRALRGKRLRYNMICSVEVS